MSHDKEKSTSFINMDGEQNIKARIPERAHSGALGQVWFALTGQNPKNILSQIAATVLEAGGTRPPWHWQAGETEYMAMAWPQDQPIRACVLLSGPAGKELKPISIFPLLEGLPNDLTVAEVYPLPEGGGANVAVSMEENRNPMWFFDPFYIRDKADLTPEVTHSFLLGAVALRINKALLDEITLTSGPVYELYAEQWLKEHKDSKSMDVPPLKIDISNKHLIMPGRFFGEYQIRAQVEELEEWHFDKMPVQVLYVAMPFDKRPALRLPIYLSSFAANGFKAEKGQFIDAYVWLQGRVIDMENISESDK